MNITAGRPLSLRLQAQTLVTNQEPRIKARLDYFKEKEEEVPQLEEVGLKRIEECS